MFPVLGDQGDAVPDPLDGVGDPGGGPVDTNAAAQSRIGAEEGAQKCAAARSQQSSQADDLPGSHLQVEAVPGMVPSPQVPDLQADRTPLVGDLTVIAGDVPAHHEPYHAVVIDLLLGQLAGVGAVAQHQDPVGQFLHLAQPV